ncbi:MAG: FAD-binding protein [Treponema sp.]|jgi:UDP-N-acetylmuramate dehydrogenase|nr:FAD-binding protein [Treponema sp.]
MSLHTTFRTGGPADVWVRPQGDSFPGYAAVLFEDARAAGIPVFILGSGANILVADRGIRGIVLDTAGWKNINPKNSIERKAKFSAGFGWRQETDGESMVFYAGTAADEAVEAAAALGLSGLEFLAGMPGSIGGALWMNARCYGKSVSDVLVETEILEFSPGVEHAAGPQRSGGKGSLPQRRLIPFNTADFGYKKSPFQGRDALILSGRFAFRPRPGAEIRREMEGYRRDREEKGHYRYPSAGSVFKNNREFGKPTGKIIDELGLRGFAAGGAQVAPFHGNIIINKGNASSADIRSLIGEVTVRVKAATGFMLEPEILFAGDW